MKRLLYMIPLSLAVAISAGSCGKSNADTQEPEWTLVWEDNFDGDTIDSLSWSKIPRGHVDWNNYMSAYDSLYAVRDGKLVLRGIANYTQKEDTARYLTGGIQTLDKRNFRNGRIEVRAKLNGAKGAWPAIWLMPQNRKGDWPDCGEIDIMERLNHDSIAYQTVHSRYTYTLKNTDNPKSGVTGAINPDDYNTYIVELYPDSVVYYINDVHTNTYPRLADIPADQNQFPFDQDWFMYIDMQLGGNWVGAVDPVELPVEMEVDWVKFYQKQ